MPPKTYEFVQEVVQGTGEPPPTKLAHPLQEHPFRHSRFSSRAAHLPPLTAYESDSEPELTINDANLPLPEKEIPEDLLLLWGVMKSAAEFDKWIEHMEKEKNPDKYFYPPNVYAIWIGRKAQFSNVIVYPEDKEHLRQTLCGITLNPHIAKACFHGHGFIVQRAILYSKFNEAETIRQHYTVYEALYDDEDDEYGAGIPLGGKWLGGDIYGLDCNEVVAHWLILQDVWKELPQQLQDAAIYLQGVGESPEGTNSARVDGVREPYAPKELGSATSSPDPSRHG